MTATTSSTTHTAAAPTASTVPSAAPPARKLAWTGVAFVVCFIVSVVASSPPKNGASDHAWIANYTGGNKNSHMITGVLLVAAALMLLTFLTMQWQRIAAAQAPVPTSPLPIVAAGMGTAAMAIGGVVMGAAGTIITNHTDPGVANLFRLSNGLGFALVALAAMPAVALSVVCLSVLGRRAGVLSRGVSTFGIVAAIALLGAIAFLPIVVLLVWVLVVSVAWLRAG
ncbi:MAG TPA: hypothetical protein VGO03_00585 [Acidimicrobiia bacterium]|jgi:hypothetical protein